MFRHHAIVAGLAASLAIGSGLATQAFGQAPSPAPDSPKADELKAKEPRAQEPKALEAKPQEQKLDAPKVVERSARGPTARNIQVGVYLNVQPDCTTGTLPALRMITQPSNGTISIKRGKVSATNYKQCLALEVPGFIAFYQSKADYIGSDEVTIEVKYPAGRTEVQRIKIDVGGSAPAGPKVPQGQKI